MCISKSKYIGGIYKHESRDQKVFFCLILFSLCAVNMVDSNSAAQGRLGFGGNYSNADEGLYDGESEPSNSDRRRQGIARDGEAVKYGQRLGRSRRINPIRKLCRDDSERYCSNMSPGLQHFQCMRKHQHDFSQQCQRAMSQHLRQRREGRRSPPQNK